MPMDCQYIELFDFDYLSALSHNAPVCDSNAYCFAAAFELASSSLI
jgi:hypothetical protein